MGENSISETGERADGLFAPAPGEGGRESAFQKRRTGQVRLRPEDLDFGADIAMGQRRAGGRGRAPGIVLLIALAVLLAAAAANPGAVAGLSPLPLALTPGVFGAAAGLAGLGAVILFIGALRHRVAATKPGAARLARRPVFVGTGAFGVQIGEDGLALASTQRRFTAYWSGFEAGMLYAGDLNAPGLPHIGKADAAGAGFDAAFGPPGDNRAVERLIEEAAAWARANAAIRLPLKHDRNFAVHTTKKGEERLVPRDREREYLFLSRRLFDEGDGDVSWPAFVAAAVLMISHHDPDWRDSIDPEPAGGA